MKQFITINYPLSSLDCSQPNILKNTISRFFKEYITDINRKYFILLKVKYINGSTYSLHTGVIITKNSLTSYLDYVSFQLSLKSEDYKNEEEYNYIIFDYFEIPKDKENYFKESRWDELKFIKIRKLKTFLFDKYLLPINMNYLSWGEVYLDTDSVKIVIVKDYHFIITKKEKSFEIKMSSLKNKDIKFIFYDQVLEDKQFFIRKIDQSIYYCDEVNESILLALKTLKTSFLKPLKIKKISKPKIITIDIETIVREGIHKPYLFSLFDGKERKSFFSDNALDLLRFLLKRKYNGYDIYAHNLSHFDIIFLLKDMAKLKNDYHFHFLKKDDKFISIRMYNTKKNISITFKDSFLLLPSSLANLSKQFNIDNPKGIEPIFQGDTKSPYYMENLDHYNKKVEIFLNLDEWKNKVQNYCEGDCIALYEILIKFRDLVHTKFQINMDNYPTTPSLSFAIFRTHFLEENTIPLFKGKIMDYIRESFTGGSTDVYIPYGKNIYWYDVNSLYPTMMKENPFPIGEMIQFQGDIKWLYKFDPQFNNKNTYWIADVNVQTKKDLYIPYLQINHISNISKRTISPNGSFTMKINSPEYNNAVHNKDYDITVNCVKGTSKFFKGG